MIDLGFNNLGFLNLSLIYGAFTLSASFVDLIIKKIGVKATLCLAATSYAIWELSFFLPSYRHEELLDRPEEELGIFSDSLIVSIFLFTGFLLGMGAGPLWVAQAYYISECANDTNKGLYNSLCISIFQISQFSSSTMTFLLLSRIGKSNFYLLMGLVGVAGALMFMSLPHPQKSC